MPGSNSNEVRLSGPLTSKNLTDLFELLGEIELDNNTGSMFQSRELKTVHLDIVCQYFKLSLSRSYENFYNKFKQVALIKVVFLGSYMSDYEINLITP